MAKRQLVLAGRFLGRGRTRAGVATVMALFVGLGVLSPLPAQALPAVTKRPKTVDHEKPVDGRHGTVKQPKDNSKGLTTEPLPPPVWPKAAVAEVTVPEKGKRSRAGQTPVWITPPTDPGGTPRSRSAPPPAAEKVRVSIVDRKVSGRAGLQGLTLTVGRTDDTTPGQVGVTVDYSQFATAFGGSYGSRLRLVQYPACVLTTPQRAECRRPMPVPSTNSSQDKTVTAQITADDAPITPPASTTSVDAAPVGTVLAVESAASGDKGDWAATPLEASSTFDIKLNTGDFTWSYPMRVPPVPSGLVPNVGINYSASLVDGKTSSTGAQSSWVGEGFELWPGFIERRYKSCKDDGAPKDEWGVSPGDQCWGYDNAVVNWNGKGGELIHVSSTTWRLKNDDGTRFDKLADTDVDNGDNNGEYWRVTAPDGTRFYFGSNKGADGQKPATGSTWTVPVFGDDDNEPCNKTTGFKDSSCPQAWRWNLDYVLDRDGNVIAYYYDQEKNHYGRNLKPEDETEYVRGGTLARIDYGLRDGQVDAKPAARVEFETEERCFADDTFNCDFAQIDTHRSYWRDTPWDLHCNDGQECKDNHGSVSPTFWSTKRLTKVTTQVIKSDATYRNVDVWSITHEFGKSDHDVTLLPRRIQHKGAALSPEVALPDVKLEFWPFANRVDKTGDDLAPYLRHRLIAITDETGGKIAIQYAPTECTPDAPPTPETNTKRCFPVFWQHGTATDPTLDWFHKYVVAKVTREDLTGLGRPNVTEYHYDERTNGKGGAWHYDDDDGITPEKYKSWSQWRGYEYVSVLSGTSDSPESRTDHYFLRGMDGDRKNQAGDKRQVTVSDGAVIGPRQIEDKDAWAGHEYRTETFDGPDGTMHAQGISRPWIHQTASRTRPWGTVTANLTGVEEASNYKLINPGPSQWWQHTKVDNLEFDTTTGAVLESEDRGAEGQIGDERCTTTSYVHNTTDWLVAFPSQVTTVAVPCNQEYDARTETISDIRTSYDGAAWGTAPVKGKATHVARLTPDPSAPLTGTPQFRRVTATKYDDPYGRATEVTDVLDNVTRTTYTQTPTPTAAVQGLTTQTTTTLPAVNGRVLSTSTTYNAAWGVPSAKIDVGGRRTEAQYDALGRLTKIWQPDRSRTLGDKPSTEYTYQVEQGKIVAVGTRTATNNGGQTPFSWQLYDGLLRPRQTQEPGMNNGRIITDTFYNSRGLVHATYGAYYNNEAAPTAALFLNENDGNIKSQTRFTYDGLGRVTREALRGGPGDNAELFATTTTYGGNWVRVTPPDGGTPTTTVYDARGQKTQVQEFNPGGLRAATTSYTYDGAGRLDTVTGPGNKVWDNTYDLLGRTIKTVDPDKGTTEFGYDALDRPTWTKDARGEKVSTQYDVLSRPTKTLDGAGNPLKSWIYDTVQPGQPTSITRYAKGPDGTTTLEYIDRVDVYDALDRPVRVTVKIPDEETGVGGEYQYNTAYSADGTLRSIGIPAAGDLPSEVLVTSYNDLQQPIRLDGITSYVTGTAYSHASGQILDYELATGGTAMWVHHEYDDSTKRLTRSLISRQQITGYDRDANYTYDDAGNITRITDNARTGTDTQCFRYDGLRRLTQAWTLDPGTDGQTCDTDPTAATIGGPAPYRIDYSYDDATGNSGNRIGETHYTAGANGGTQVATRTYTYAGGTGVDASVKGHMLGTVTQTADSPFSGPAANEHYTYNPDGSTNTRTIGTTAQVFDYDAEGEIRRITERKDAQNTAATTFVYAVNGDRLIRRDPNGTTLYLPGMEVRRENGQTTATRYYNHGGQQIAMRTGAGVTFLTPDHQGTSQLAISSTAITDPAAISQRRFTPFGQERGTAPTTWPTAMDKGFVGGTKDPTTTPGLKPITHLGARHYDPNTGRFLSVDPIANFGDSQQINGYTYANNTPVTLSDPTGLYAAKSEEEGCSCASGYEPGDGGGGSSSGGGWIFYVTKTGEFLYGFGWEANKWLTPHGVLLHIPGAKDWFFSLGDMDAGSGATRAGGITFDIVSSATGLGGLVRGGAKGVINLGGRALSALKGGAARGLGTLADDMGRIAIGAAKIAAANAQRVLAHMADDAMKLTATKGKDIGAAVGGAKAAGGTVKAAVTGGKRAPRSAGCNSFVPGTMVLMADGEKKPIEDLKIGDKVLATDPETGKTHAKVVVATIGGQGQKELVEVTVDTDGAHGDRTGLVIATDEHPFWVAGVIQRWINAEDLRPGMWLRTSAGTYVQVKATHTRTSPAQRVHNLTVAEDHTYYIFAGQASVLVHNCDGDVHWVPENAHMSPAAQTYDAGATGSRPGLAPALQYYKPGGNRLSQVKFDGYDAVNGVLIDRKVSVTTFNKAFRQAQNQSLALEQNGLSAVWEVPNAAQAARARSILGQQMIMNIRVRIVP